MRGFNVTDSHTREQTKRRLLERHAATSPQSWRSVATALGLPKAGAMLARIAADRQKPPDSVLDALGIQRPPRLVELHDGEGIAPICPKCGIVHTTKRCTAHAKRSPRMIADMSRRELLAALEKRK